MNKGNFLKKIKGIFFENFFYKRKFCSVWKQFTAKIILILQCICFEVVQNVSKSECSKLEQRFVINFLLAENCKPCGIYRRMFDPCFIKKKMFTNGLNMVLPLWVWIRKIFNDMKIHWLFVKEKVPGATNFFGKFTLFIEWPSW